MFRTIHDIVLMIDRASAERATEPTTAVIDSRTVKAPAPGGERGFDGAKKTVGSKRHIAVDADGRLLLVHLTPANISDGAGAQAVLQALHSEWPWVKQLFADGAYDRRQLMDKAAFLTSRWTSSSGPMRLSLFYHAAGSWNEHWGGRPAVAASCAIAKAGSTRPKP